MDRNSIIGLVLIMGILFGYAALVNPSAEELAKQKLINDSIAASTPPAASESEKPATANYATTIQADSIITPDSTQLATEAIIRNSKFGEFANAGIGSEETKKLETEKFTIIFSNKGGRIKDIQLKEYNTHKGTPVHLFDPSSAVFGFNLALQNKGIVSTQDLYFKAIPATDKITGDKTANIVYRLQTNDPTQFVELIYTVKGNSYDIDLQINNHGLENIIASDKKLTLDWKITGLNNEKSVLIERQRSSVFFKTMEDDRDYLSETSEEDEEIVEESINWVAYKQYFFTAAIISNQGFTADKTPLSITQSTDSIHNKAYSALLTVPMSNVSNGSANLKFYFGPNKLEELSALNVPQFDRIIDFGWGIFGWVNKYFIYYVFKFLTWFNLGVGVTILLLTIVIKMLLMPLTYKNYQSSAKMRILKPEVDAINEKLKNADPMKKQQEMMALYKQTGVNPLAGCIPVLIQMPFLYAMFRFFPATIDLRQQSFLWADDLSSYDSIYDLGFNIPMYGDHISLFTILMCASTFVYTRMNSANMPTPQAGMPDMRMIMYIFPFMMLFFFNNFSSGLSWYYFAANIVTMLQTFVIRKYFVDEQKMMKIIEENKKKPASKSKFQKRMEEMANKRGIKLPK